MESTAIIGTGIAGLGCAHLLQHDRELSLFDRNGHAGGHANTIEVGEGIPVDTGFMVYNEVTYPALTRLFRELEVSTYPTSMSFSVQHLPTGLEYCGSGLRLLFAQRRNLLRPRFYRLLVSIDRFNREAVAALSSGAARGSSVGEWVARRGYGSDLLEHFLLPMSAAVWSAPFAEMLSFPAETLLRFFHNHGFLGLHKQHPWRSVTGGSRTYVEKLTRPFQSGIHRDRRAIGVRREESGVRVRFADGDVQRFDEVVLACHADEALALLEDATDQEQRLLSPFRYARNLATVHTDDRVMPRTRRSWASWNYRVEGNRGDLATTAGSTVYWMNSLQQLNTDQNYFISINGEASVDPARVLRTIPYTHPLFSAQAIAAQRDLPQLNQQGPVYFCGSYFGYGFHEDALVSGMDAAKALRRREVWAAA
ncbi:MAG: FAD-dependent oxidoreductase [Thermoanaerobaculia bacterium]